MHLMNNNSILCTYLGSQVDIFKTAFEHKQFDCLGTYDILSEIGKRKREFVGRGVEV